MEVFVTYDLRIKYMKETENIRADVLNRKLRYKEKQKPKDLFIFRKDKNDLIFNK
jgi:hypothetical protein